MTWLAPLLEQNSLHVRITRAMYACSIVNLRRLAEYAEKLARESTSAKEATT
jgi:hypothetical protein